MKQTNQPRWDSLKRNYVYDDQPKPMNRADKIVVTVCIIAAIALFIITKVWG